MTSYGLSPSEWRAVRRMVARGVDGRVAVERVKARRSAR